MGKFIDSHIHCDSSLMIAESIPKIIKNGITQMGLLSYGKMEALKGNGGPGSSNPHNHLPALSLSKDEFANNLLEQVTRFADVGFDGIKLLESKPSVYNSFPYKLHDPIFDAFFEALIAADLPVVWHVGDPETFWDPELAPPMAHINGWFYGDGTFPSLETLWEDSLSILKQHPKLTVIFAHFYFMSPHLKRLADLLDQYPGMNVDITPGTEMYSYFSINHDKARNFFIKYQDRIVFGTDTCISTDSFYEPAKDNKVTWMRRFLESGDTFDLNENIKNIHGLNLPQDVLDKIYVANFTRLLGDKPRPFKKALAVKECDKLIQSALQANFTKQDIQPFEEAKKIINST